MKSRAVWCVAQIIVALLTLITFFIWAPWMGAISREEAVTLYGNVVPPECLAVTVNHGHFSCLSLGTVSSNPWIFALCTVVLLSGIAFLVFTQATRRGFASISFRSGIPEVAGRFINWICRSLGYSELDPKQVEKTMYLVLFALFVAVLFLLVIYVLESAKFSRQFNRFLW